MNRVIEVDYAKGIGILLVMFGHSIALMDNPLNIFILSFHMPLFFFCSGIVMKQGDNFIDFIKKRVKNIGIAVMIQYLLYVIIGLLIDVAWYKNATILSFDYIRGMNNWFLYVMLISIVLTKITNRYCRVTMIIAWLLFLNFKSENIFPKTYFEQALLAYVFCCLGACYGKQLLELCRNNKNILLEISIGLFGITYIVSQYNGPCAMSANIYGMSKILFSLTAVLGTIGVLCFTSCGISSKLLNFCGKNSLFLFVTHFSVQRIIIAIWDTKLPNYPYIGYPYYIAIFVLLLFSELLLLCFYKKLINSILFKREGKKCHYLQEKH